MNNKFYFYGLDGLRALAIIFVICYHLEIFGMSGGFIGVDIFFFISGFLITSVLLKNYLFQKNSSIYTYFKKRIKRIVPPTFFIIAITILCLFFVNSEALVYLKTNLLYVLTFTYNYGLIVNDVDYFTAINFYDPLLHLWSIAVEMQFYILIGLGFALLKNKIKSVNKFILVLVILIVLSIIATQFIFEVDNVSRVYYATGTRIYELLLGSVFAFMYNKRIGKVIVRLLERNVIINSIISAIVLFVLIVFAIVFDNNSIFLFRGGFIIINLLTAILLISFQAKNNIVSKLFEMKPIVEIGKRSFSLYLVHYPIIAILLFPTNIDKIPAWIMALVIVLIIACSEINYYLIEQPLLIKRKSPIKYFTYVLVTIVMFVSLYTLTLQSGASNTFGDLTKTTTDYLEITNNVDTQINSTHEKIELYKQAVETLNKKDVLMIGDSISLGMKPFFESNMNNSFVDGSVGRQMSQVRNVAKQYGEYNHENSVVVLQMGTNGYMQEHELTDFVEQFPKSDIYLITTAVDRQWKDSNNNLINKVASNYDNVHVVEWDENAEGHPEYFVYDGVHLTKQGMEKLTILLKQKIVEVEQNK